MHCSKCGKEVPVSARFCQNCGEPIIVPVPKPPQKTKPKIEDPSHPFLSSTISLFVTLTSTIVLAYGISPDISTEGRIVILSGWMTLGFILMQFLFKKFFIYLDKILREIPKKPILLLPIGLGIFLIFCAIYSIAVQYSYSNIDDTLPNLQNTVLEVAVSKSIGDAIQSGITVPAGWTKDKIYKTNQDRAEWLGNLPAASKLENYKKSLTAWTAEIRDAAKDPKKWKELDKTPADFSLVLNSDKANELFGESAKKILELKEFGDLAVKNKDRQAMRYIAAKILIQKHWMDGIAHSKDPGFLAFDLIIPARAYSGAPRKICNLDYRGRGVCYEEMETTTTDMYNAADAYAQGKGDQPWTDFNQQLENTQILSGVGITQGEPDKPAEYPPAVQNFMNNCRARGGRINGSGTSVKTRLPTTESGFNCDYKQGGNSCWEMLTYAGDYYAGGNPGCPEANLLPPAVVEPPPKPTPKPTGDGLTPTKGPTPPPQACNFNGNYPVTGTLTCQSNYRELNFSQSASDTLVVSNNMIKDGEGNWYRIDSSGNVKISFAAPASISGSGSGWATYHFYCSGTRALVKGSISVSANASAGNMSIQMQCTGTTSGSKN